MTLGIIFAFGSALLFATNNLLGKYISQGLSISTSLIIQYVLMVIFGTIAVALVGDFSAPLDALGWGVLAGCGVIGYAGIAFLLWALRCNPVGVVMAVSYAYVFVAYILNAWLFPGIEKLSPLRLILGGAFFLTIVVFLFERNQGGKMRLNLTALLPLVTALCWGVYMAAMNWFLKTDRLTDVQTTLYSSSAILCVALLVGMLAWKKGKPRVSSKKLTRRQSQCAYLGWGLAMYGGALTANMAFFRAPANLVNFIGLSAVILTPILSYVFFRETLTRKNLITIIVAAFLLGTFVLMG